MKTHHLITLAFVFALSLLRAEAGFLLPEDAISKDYWQSLDAKSKIVFLTAFRHGQGPSIDIKAALPFKSWWRPTSPRWSQNSTSSTKLPRTSTFS